MTRQFLTSAVLATLTLSACGLTDLQSGSDGGSTDSEASADSGGSTDSDGSADSGSGSVMNINTNGPTVCLDAAIEKLGADAMVNEISSHFQVSKDIDPPLIENDNAPAPGDLWICEAFYQDPSDPVKLLSIKMDTDNGEFGEPEPVEIQFSGDAADFDLNDYVIKASDIDTSIIQPKMDEEAPGLDETFKLWQWDRVSLEAPGPFSDVHVFDLSMKGRLAQNDLTETGFISIAMDGTVVNDALD